MLEASLKHISGGIFVQVAITRSTNSAPARPTAAGSSRADRRIGQRDLTEWRTPAGRRLASQHREIAKRVGARRTLVGTPDAAVELTAN